MTEKRFSRHIDFFIDNERTGDKLMNMDEVVDLLNEQSETIQSHKRLLEEIRHELTRFNGMDATTFKTGSNPIIHMEFTDLINQIDKVLDNE